MRCSSGAKSVHLEVGGRFLGGAERLTNFGRVKNLHLRMERKNQTTTCRSTEKLKLTHFEFRGDFCFNFSGSTLLVSQPLGLMLPQRAPADWQYRQPATPPRRCDRLRCPACPCEGNILPLPEH